MNALFKIVQDLLHKVTCRHCGHTQSTKNRDANRKNRCERCGEKLEGSRKVR